MNAPLVATQNNNSSSFIFISGLINSLSYDILVELVESYFIYHQPHNGGYR